MESLRCCDSSSASFITTSAFSASCCNNVMSHEAPGINLDIAIHLCSTNFKIKRIDLKLAKNYYSINTKIIHCFLELELEN